ncbi:hypothetical protein H2248_005794 [Termitomyces sp. 'cryptogamus']|nr:hypothetical protein H2248_005794 [Termitomyces sp. 'cryptogamus']
MVSCSILALRCVLNSDSHVIVFQELEAECASFGLGIPSLFFPGQGGGSSMTPATGTRTSTGSIATNSASSNFLTSTRLPTLSVPPLPSTFTQKTVTADTRTTAPMPTTTMAPEGNGISTMGPHTSVVLAAILGFVIVAIEYLG